MADETIYIKQLLLADDVSLGTKPETQVRNGVSVTGEQLNATHLLYNNPGSVWHEQTVNTILTALIESTGITPIVPA